MREIKFRAWHKEKRCWLDSVHVYGDGSWSGSLIEPRGEIDGYDERECELIQYTGLLDKNGIEIYEGDIIKRVDDSLRLVKWSQFGFQLFSTNLPDRYWNSDAEDWHMSEVIGNIYENPELIGDNK